MHAVELVSKHLLENDYKHVLLLATKFTMEDGFFAKLREKNGIKVTIPKQEERETMKIIHS